jgi:hypothetical protein
LHGRSSAGRSASEAIADVVTRIKQQQAGEIVDMCVTTGCAIWTAARRRLQSGRAHCSRRPPRDGQEHFRDLFRSEIARIARFVRLR